MQNHQEKELEKEKEKELELKPIPNKETEKEKKKEKKQKNKSKEAEESVLYLILPPVLLFATLLISSYVGNEYEEEFGLYPYFDVRDLSINIRKELYFSEDRKTTFLDEWGSAYGYNNTIDDFASSEKEHLKGDVYLDYTGSAIYTKTLVDEITSDWKINFYSNVHSRSTSSVRTEEQIQTIRRLVLEWFNTSDEEYSVIFTSGATASLKLVGESFPWKKESQFVYCRSNHNSVIGIREFATQFGAGFTVVTEPDLVEKDPEIIAQYPSFCEKSQMQYLTEPPDDLYHLFAYPAESNFDGSKFNLSMIDRFHHDHLFCNDTGKWLVLLDAAAFVPTNRLDLSRYKPDFVALSFYKMFGLPTGIGALLVHNSVAPLMQKLFFGGGTVMISSCESHLCVLHPNPSTRFEDGTVNFLSIIALKYGINMLNSLGIQSISDHVWTLTRYLYTNLISLSHSNGQPFVEIYGKHHLNNPLYQGSIIAFNLKNPDGTYVGYFTIQKDSADAGFHLRTEDIHQLVSEKRSCGDKRDFIHSKPFGVVRVSLGYLTTFEEVDYFLTFLKMKYLDWD
ncbi:molybdenum cofactor sulfurase [Anaeramoeba ignava]|uniref:Molybdenum cofactor sulfurase n=1 Tax=Anaeramoeba ignava TaxID=1746090 RepID=A0A9Q0R960_ANAIG|nr:molybdenum cofactor sulfurase [Anaeramoeba ignava]